MSHNALAGGMILGGLAGASPAAYAKAGIKAFLLPGELAGDPAGLVAAVAEARAAVSEAGLGRALVAIGASGRPRFGLPPCPDLPSPLGIASLGSVAAARRAGYLLGSRLRSLGVDMVLGPRLDLASDPKDPAGALDGFGEDARVAGLLGAAYARGLARAGVAACVGRFPGLGAICSDCYEGMPFIALPAARLERCEMRPFARAVQARVPAILVGRVLVPSLESERIPASASARVIEGRLRVELGFRGLAIGDDLVPGEDPGRAALLGALAGCDLGLFSRPAEALAAAAALDEAAARGGLPLVRVESARRRFERLLPRRERGEGGEAPGPAAAAARKAKRDIAASFSLLRGSLELDSGEDADFGKTLVVVFLPPAGAPDAGEAGKVLAAIGEELPGAAVRGLPADPGEADIDDLVRELSAPGRYAEAALLTYDAHFRPSQESLARLVGERLPRFRLVAMRDPYDAAFFPDALGLGAAYGFCEDCARTAARLLAGRAKPRGGNPVEVIGLEV
jgi:beta-N-acetylhexosaminidase